MSAKPGFELDARVPGSFSLGRAQVGQQFSVIRDSGSLPLTRLEYHTKVPGRFPPSRAQFKNGRLVIQRFLVLFHLAGFDLNISS